MSERTVLPLVLLKLLVRLVFRCVVVTVVLDTYVRNECGLRIWGIACPEQDSFQSCGYRNHI